MHYVERLGELARLSENLRGRRRFVNSCEVLFAGRDTMYGILHELFGEENRSKRGPVRLADNSLPKKFRPRNPSANLPKPLCFPLERFR